MGAYSPLPDLDDAAVERVLETVHRPILAELARRGTPFRGFLYAGLILTADGPVLLECNVRLGDPEAQVILPRLAGALGPLLLAAAARRAPGDDAAAVPDAARTPPSGIVLAAKGYPGDPRRGDPIEGIDAAAATGALVFHAGTIERPRWRGSAPTAAACSRSWAWARPSTTRGARPSAAPARSRGTACSAATTSPTDVPPSPGRGA